MTIYLQDVKEINGVMIKERYGEEFKKLQRSQHMPRYIVVSHNWTLQEFRRIQKAEQFCEALIPVLKAAPLLMEAAAWVLKSWEHGNLAGAVRDLQSAFDAAKGDE